MQNKLPEELDTSKNQSHLKYMIDFGDTLNALIRYLQEQGANKGATKNPVYMLGDVQEAKTILACLDYARHRIVGHGKCIASIGEVNKLRKSIRAVVEKQHEPHGHSQEKEVKRIINEYLNRPKVLLETHKSFSNWLCSVLVAYGNKREKEGFDAGFKRGRQEKCH